MILLIASKFSKVGPIFGPLPSILDRFSTKGLFLEFFASDALSLGFFSFNLTNTISETLLCKPCLPSRPPWRCGPRWTLQSSCSFPKCSENVHCDGSPSEIFVWIERKLRTRTEINCRGECADHGH